MAFNDSYRVHFEKMTDFFGRIIVYDFQLYGITQI